MKILNFGSCNIDYVYSVDHIVVPGETLSARKMEVFSGGKGLNQSVAAARAGAQVCHAGVIGRDGGMLRQVLEQSGADVTWLETADSPNGHAIIQVSANAQNSIFLYEGTNGMVTRPFIDRVLDRFEAGDILLLQNEISNVPYLIARGHEKGMTVVFNPAPFHESLLKLDLNMIDYLILNEVEASGFFGSTDVDGVLQRKKELCPELKLVITLGKKGCVYADGRQVVMCPAFQVEAVDTTAAGDTFTGYFVSLMADGCAPEDAIRTACAASALAVSAMGAAPSIPVMAQVREALKTLEPYPGGADKRGQLKQRILTYVEENLADAGLQALAAQLGYSDSYTGRLVKELTGETFGQLLLRKRCEAAAVALRETDTPVSQIVRAVGYHNESFFRTAFQKFCGRTPLQYRKQWTGGNQNDQ